MIKKILTSIIIVIAIGIAVILGFQARPASANLAPNPSQSASADFGQSHSIPQSNLKLIDTK
jgi:hypothetical protein